MILVVILVLPTPFVLCTDRSPRRTVHEKHDTPGGPARPGCGYGSFCSVYREEGVVEPNRENIEDLMRRCGYAEDEAEVHYHLVRAYDLLTEMLDESIERHSGPEGGLPGFLESMFRMSNVDPHFRALFALLDKRVLNRDYPERLVQSD